MSESTGSKEIAQAGMSSKDRKTPKKLGRGLGALMGEAQREEPLVRRDGAPPREAVPSVSAKLGQEADRASVSPLRNVEIALIEPLPGNPRKHFDEDALDELAASISARGVIQPIIVRPWGQGRFQLVAGERRWRAAQKAHLHEIPALVRDLEEREVMALSLIENLQREDLNPVEEARAYQRLASEEGMTQAEIARMVEKSRSHVANLQRLLTLPEDVLDLVEGGRLSMGHARALIGQDEATELARRAVNDNLSVREIEKIVRKKERSESSASSKREDRSTSGEQSDIVAVQNHLEEFLGLKVHIKADADPRSGAVTIRYKTLDQLDLVCQRLTGGEF